jgi:hypothetical protein
VLYLPTMNLGDPRDFLECLTQELQSAFKEAEEPKKEHLDEADGWADIDGSAINTATETSPAVEVPPVAPLPTKPVSHYLPKVDTMARPDEILSRPPYQLQVLTMGASLLEVRCSHSPTLQVLHDYLKRWCRADNSRTDRPPILDIQLHQLPFGLGNTYDRLTVSSQGRRAEPLMISPTMIMNIVESQFGYEKVYQEGSNWHYRRDIPFK